MKLLRQSVRTDYPMKWTIMGHVKGMNLKINFHDYRYRLNDVTYKQSTTLFVKRYEQFLIWMRLQDKV